MMKPSKSQLVRNAMLLVIGIAVSFFLGMRVEERLLSAKRPALVRVDGIGQMPPANVSDQIEFKEFWDEWQLLKQKFYQQPVLDKTLFYGAMAGLAESLGDPYTNFFEPKSAEDFQQSLAGKFEGIGAEIGMKEGQLTIIAPLSDTPAERAGLLAGDAIVKIDGQETSGMSVEKAVSLIRGPKGTRVTLNIFRVGKKKAPFDVTVTRDEIHVKSVHWKMLKDGIAYIEVTHFNGDTRDGFDAAVKAVLTKNPKGLILDLRNNPGGFLDAALGMAGEWIGSGIVTKERKQGKIIEELRGTGQSRLRGIPTIVLVNQGSASASEIVAGALQDAKQAVLVGMKTFGKGSVQEPQELNDGSLLKITIAEWLTPKERSINKSGLDPDIIVDRTPEDYENQRDPQLDRAQGILNGTATGTLVIPSASRSR